MRRDTAPERILITADAVGGVWSYALELIAAFPQTQFALAVMGPPPSATQQRQIPANARLSTFDGALEWQDAPWNDVDRAGDWLLALAREFQPELVHLNGYAHAVLPWDVPVLVVAHSCVFSWWRAVKKNEPPARFDEYRKRVSAGVRAATLVVAPSAAMLDSIREEYGRPAADCVIWNARRPEDFQPGTKQPLIFAAARAWDPAKNLEALDAVAPRVRWPIEVAGDDVHPNGGRAAFRNVRGLGELPLQQLRERLAVSAVYALPARYEPFGLSVLEAALSGCALLLGDIASLRELWGDAALYVEPENHVALERELNRMAADGSLRMHLAAAARRRALVFSPATMRKGYAAAYCRCLAATTTADAAS